MKKPNVLWLMSDQHNANCTGYAGHPDVRTPNLDRVAAGGVNFSDAFCNNPICAPSRVSFITGQYCHTHGLLSNDNRSITEPNLDSVASVFRRYGYQTALIGKSHMVPAWDAESFEFRRYTDLIDASAMDPTTNHYFKYLCDLGLEDYYEEGTAKPGQDHTLDGQRAAALPYEHSIERFTGNETLNFLQGRDRDRPFFVQMSFQRPHGPITPAREHFDRYDPDTLTLPANARDWLENRFEGKPGFMVERLRRGCRYPLAADESALRRVLASYYALISCIDDEIGRVLDQLEQTGDLDNTIVFYTADHGDFAGEHGLFHKNFGIYDSIHRIPFLLNWPGGPEGVGCEEIVESVDWYPTVCALCGVPVPDGREGSNLLPVVGGEAAWKEAAFCEWGHCSAVRTAHHRLVFYRDSGEGELYDHRDDPGEAANRWSDPDYQSVKVELLQRLLSFTMHYGTKGPAALDTRYAPTPLVQFGQVYWRDLQRAYETKGTWPPREKGTTDT